MNYRQLADHVKQRQRLRHRKMTEPQDDWMPEAYFLRANGHLSRQDIPPGWFENAATKDALVHDVFLPFIHVGHVRIFALTVVMFMISGEHPVGQVIEERYEAGDERPTRGLPYFQDIEGSIEQLWVHIVDAERYEGWCATITRPKRGRPQLAPFQMPTSPDLMGGRMIDPIKAALR
jgi:hypothetical protein